MPRCYLVKKSGQRHQGPPPCSPTEASVAPPCYNPPEQSTLTEDRGTKYAELGRSTMPERSQADREAAQELLSLAASVPPLPPAMLTVLRAPDPLPLYTYTIQPTNIYILADEPPERLYQALPTVGPIQYATVEPQLNFVAYQPVPQQPTPQSKSTHEQDSKEESLSEQDDAVSLSCPRDKGGKYDCNECGKTYATSSNLSRHKQTHRSLDSVSAKRCGECGKAYVSMPALAMHVLTHRMNHVCAECGKQFSRPWLLRGHLRSHTGEKPYICASCGKAFADRSNLRAHLQTHSSDKKHECLRCQKSFALKSYLNKHQESACVRSDEE